MAIKADTLGAGKLSIGQSGTLKEFQSQVTKAVLKPSVKAGDNLTVLSGETLAGKDEITWTLEVTLLQDFGNAGHLEWLFTNRGKELPFKFVPNNESQRAWTGNLKVRPADIGGDVGKQNTSDVSFDIVGEPTPAAAG